MKFFLANYAFAETKKDSAELTSAVNEEKGKTGEDILAEKNSGVVPSKSGLPCMDKLREELSCAVRTL